MVDTPVNRPSIQDGSVVQSGFFSNILTPGSSLNPTFLLALDIAFGLLLCVFLVLLVLTRGSVHIIVLIGIEACLWTSVKWFVHELKQVQSLSSGDITGSKKSE